MNKKLKTILIVLIILVVGYFLVNYAMLKMGEYLFKTEVINAEEVAGKTDNNSYGIRNDVYDVVQKEYVEKLKLNEEQKILVYNIASVEQELIESYSDSDLVLKNIEKLSILIRCGHFNGNGKLTTNFVKKNGVFNKAFLNTENRLLAHKMASFIFSKNQSKVRQFPKDNECELIKNFKGL